MTFVTFEGIDGAGKSSHLAAAEQWLRGRGVTVRVTREPGGTELAEALRALFLHHEMDALTEMLLVFAARRDHLRRLIEPALARGETVLCDRYTDATYAYQVAGRGFDAATFEQLAGWVQQGREPDLTLWFDVPAAVAAQRRAQARSADRLEAEDLAFFERVGAGYAERAARAPGRILRIDGNRPAAEVEADVLRTLGERL